jgi:hypothetical protein
VASNGRVAVNFRYVLYFINRARDVLVVGNGNGFRFGSGSGSPGSIKVRLPFPSTSPITGRDSFSTVEGDIFAFL